MGKPSRPKRNILVLWRWSAAENCDGWEITSSVGGQMRHVQRGDTLFVVATRDSELFLLGALQVDKVGRELRKEAREEYGKYKAAGRSLSGPFRIIPLGRQKWKLRFGSSTSTRLSRRKKISDQVRAHRFLTPESAGMLGQLLKLRRHRQPAIVASLRKEGAAVATALAKRERDPRVRRDALARFGRLCMICGLDFEERYGWFARDCVEVHHLDPIGTRRKRGSLTGSDTVIVACPNCHRALHRYKDPTAWRRFRSDCGLDKKRR
jgi:hypothetical protein